MSALPKSYHSRNSLSKSGVAGVEYLFGFSYDAEVSANAIQTALIALFETLSVPRG